MKDKAIPLEPLYKSSLARLLPLLSQYVSSDAFIIDCEIPVDSTYNGQPIKVKLTKHAYILRKTKYTYLEKDKSPKYVLFFNEKPVGAGYFGAAYKSCIYYKYDAGQWEFPIKIKYSDKYLLKIIKKKPEINVNIVQREVNFNRIINGPSFTDIDCPLAFCLPIRCEKGIRLDSLLAILKKNPDFLTPLQYFALARSLLNEMAYIHSLNLIHCDIKPENIMVDLNTLTMRHIDFGLMQYEHEKLGKKGTPFFIDPQSLKQNFALNKISDTFSALTCLLRFFGINEEEQLYTLPDLNRYNKNINTDRACLNISNMTSEEKWLIRNTLHSCTRYERAQRFTNISLLMIFFEGLIIQRFSNPSVSAFEKINSTMINEAILQWGFDVVIGHINNQFHMLSLDVIKALKAHTLNLSETDILSQTLRQETIDFYKLRELHKLGGVFHEQDFNYWLNERPMTANDIQAWAEICLYIYHDKIKCSPIVLFELTDSNELKHVFNEYFLNPNMPWQDVTIGEKIQRHLSLKKQQTKLITSIEQILALDAFKNIAFTKIIHAELAKKTSNGLLSNETPIAALIYILGLCKNFEALSVKCNEYCTRPDTKLIIDLFNNTIKDETLTFNNLITVNNELVPKLKALEKNIKDALVVPKVTPIAIAYLSSTAIEYCYDIENARIYLQWMTNHGLDKNYGDSIQVLIDAAIKNFHPNITNAELSELNAKSKKLHAFKAVIDELDKNPHIAPIKNIIMSSLPVMLNAIASDKQLDIFRETYQLLNDLPELPDFITFDKLELDNLTPSLFAISTIIERVTRADTFKNPITQFLNKINIYETTLKNTPSWDNLKKQIDNAIIKIIIDGAKFSILKDFLNTAILLEQFVIDNENYPTEAHKRIYECAALHVDYLTRETYNELQTTVTKYLPSLNENALKRACDFIAENKISAAINALSQPMSNSPQAIFWKAIGNGKKQRLSEQPSTRS